MHKHIFYMCLLFLIATAVFFFKWNAIPRDLTIDEIEFTRFALLLNDTPYQAYNEYATGHATLYFYIILASFKLFGLSQEALRLPSALFGIASVLIMYGVATYLWKGKDMVLSYGKKAFSISYAFLTAMTFGLLRWYFQFGRFSFEATFVVFLELCSLLAILVFIDRVKKPMFTLSEHIYVYISAIFSGLAFNSYQPGRLFAAIPLFSLFIHEKTRKVTILISFLLLFLTFTIPLNYYFAQQKDVRIQQQLYFSDPNLTSVQKAQFLGENIVNTVLMFGVKGDDWGKHNYPNKAALQPIHTGLFTIGLAYMVLTIIRKKKRKSSEYTNEYAIMLAWFALGIFPTLLTYPHENPNMLRTVTAIPTVAYAIIVGLSFAYEFAIKYAQKFKNTPQKVYTASIGILMCALLGVSIVYDMRTYFIFQKQVFEQAFEIKDGFASVYTFVRNRDLSLKGITIPHEDVDTFNSLMNPDLSK